MGGFAREDARKLPVQTLCMKHGVCMTRCDVCEHMLSYWHANDCRGSPCSDLFGKGEKLKSSLDCWDALSDMQRGGLLVEDSALYDLQLQDCATRSRSGLAKFACSVCERILRSGVYQ